MPLSMALLGVEAAAYADQAKWQFANSPILSLERLYAMEVT
jgi:hypothetical protein